MPVMGRFNRAVAVDVPHHVTQRGNGRRFISPLRLFPEKAFCHLINRPRVIPYHGCPRNVRSRMRDWTHSLLNVEPVHRHDDGSSIARGAAVVACKGPNGTENGGVGEAGGLRPIGSID